MDQPRSLLALAVDIRQWLDADAANPGEDRQQRDRRVGDQISAARDYQRVLAWWNIIAHNDAGSGDKLVLLTRITNGILMLLGLLLGASVASIALSYQGDYPVNLFALLGVQVGIPLLMLLISLLMLASPMPQTLRDAFNVLSPGRWAGGWLERRLSTQLFDSLTSRGDSARFARWQLMAFSQLFAIGYFVGVLVVSSLLVVFTDLAFGWSSTIEISSTSVNRLVALLAAPWQWLPAAVPDPALVETSRFFRLEGQVTLPDRAAQLGRWWPFVLMCTLTYGLLPRLVMAAVASWRLRAATIALLENGPHIRALLDRLDSPIIDFAADIDSAAAPGDAVARPLEHLQPGPDDIVVNWNAVLAPDELTALLQRWHLPTDRAFNLAEWDPGETRAATLRSMPGKPKGVIILTKGWDPPLLAFVDLVADFQTRWGPATTMSVVPLDTSRQQVAPADANTWNMALTNTRAQVAGTFA